MKGHFVPIQMTEDVRVFKNAFLFAAVHEVPVWYQVAVISSLVVMVSYQMKLWISVAKLKSSPTITGPSKLVAFCIETWWMSAQAQLSDTFHVTGIVNLSLLFVQLRSSLGTKGAAILVFVSLLKAKLKRPPNF